MSTKKNKKNSEYSLIKMRSICIMLCLPSVLRFKNFFSSLVRFSLFSNGGKCEKETVETKATHKYELREEPTCCKKYKIKERHVVSVCVCVLPA